MSLEDNFKADTIDQDALDTIHRVIENVAIELESHDQATSEGSRAHHYIELHNEVSQLITWHPRYDYTRGIIVPEEEYEA